MTMCSIESTGGSLVINTSMKPVLGSFLSPVKATNSIEKRGSHNSGAVVFLLAFSSFLSSVDSVDVSVICSSAVVNPLPDEKLKEDGALFILSMARGIMSRDNHNDVSTGDVIFKDMQRLIRDYLAIELNMPGKAIKPLNLRTHIIHFVPNADGTALEKKVTDGVSVSKIEGGQDKTVKYRFLPKIAPRW